MVGIRLIELEYGRLHEWCLASGGATWEVLCRGRRMCASLYGETIDYAILGYGMLRSCVYANGLDNHEQGSHTLT